MAAPNTGKPQLPVDEALAAKVEGQLLKRIEDDKLILPTMPAVALKSLELLKKADFAFKEVASLLEQDPVLTTRILKLASSVVYGPGGRSIGLQESLTRLGAKQLKTTLVEASAEKVFISKDAKIASSAKKLWLHSVAVAALARDLCALTGRSDSEEAYLAGLLHDVGKPVVASYLLEAERQIAELRSQSWIDSATFNAVIGRTHRKVAVVLAEKWKLPVGVSKCIKDCSEYDSADRSSLVNSVCLANALSKTVGYGPEGADVEDAKALVMIGRSLLGADDELLMPLVGSLKQRIDNIYD